MHVDPAQSLPPETSLVDQLKNLCVGCQFGGRQRLEVGQNRGSRFEVPAGQFTQNEWMHEHKTLGQTIGQRWSSPPEVLNPDGHGSETP
jgi:hypothetical protein